MLSIDSLWSTLTRSLVTKQFFQLRIKIIALIFGFSYNKYNENYPTTIVHRFMEECKFLKEIYH